MTLVVHELVTFLAQSFTVGSKNAEITAVRPHLVKYGSPAGSFYIEIQDADGQLIATSNALTAAEISSASYFHGHVRFDVTAGLKAGRVIRVALKATGYTFSEATYIAWANRSGGVSETEKLDTEFWNYNRLQKGIVA